MGLPEQSLHHRAERFTLALPVSYRRPGDQVWTSGLSINVSHTGVLFSADGDVLPCGECIELQMRLPALEGLRGCEIQCTGHVVHCAPAQSGGGRPSMAVRIERYLFVPGSFALPQLRGPAPALPPGGNGL